MLRLLSITLILMRLSYCGFASDQLTILLRSNVSDRTFMNVAYSIDKFDKNFNHKKAVGIYLIANIDSIYQVTIEADSIKGLAFMFYNKRTNPLLTIYSIDLIYNHQDTIHFNNNDIVNEFNLVGIKTLKKEHVIQLVLNKTFNGQNYSRINLQGNSIKKLYAARESKTYIRDSLTVTYKSSGPVRLTFYYNTNDKGPYNMASSQLWPQTTEQTITLPILNEGIIGNFRIDFTSDNPFTLQLGNIRLKGVELSPNKMKRLFDFSSFESARTIDNVLILDSKGEGSLIFKYDLEPFKLLYLIVISILFVTIVLFFINKYSFAKNILKI